MSDSNRILIADDEDTFLRSTADLLRREGYHCDCVPDAPSALEKLQNNTYDLLIADIKMPGNPELQLIRRLPDIAEGMAAILVTGFPSRQSAVDAIHLPVIAYMVKPLDFQKLLEQVNTSVAKSRLYRAITDTKQRLKYWQQNLGGFETVSTDATGAFSGSVKGFLDLSLANVVGALSDIRSVMATSSEHDVTKPVCNLMNCPKLAELTGAIQETIKTLEKTKGAFKSKELGHLRKKLQNVLTANQKI